MDKVKKKNQIIERIWQITSAIFILVLLVTIVYALVNISNVPSGESKKLDYPSVKYDYISMIFLSVSTIVIIVLPRIIIEYKFNIKMPVYIYILTNMTMLFHAYIGYILNMYTKLSYWDVYVHAMSGIAIAVFSFWLLIYLNRNRKYNPSKVYIALIALCISISFSTLWEIEEFVMDGFLDDNMQEYMSVDEVNLSGRLAVRDTMKDIIVGTISSGITIAIMYVNTTGYRLKIDIKKKK